MKTIIAVLFLLVASTSVFAASTTYIGFGNMSSVGISCAVIAGDSVNKNKVGFPALSYDTKYTSTVVVPNKTTFGNYSVVTGGKSRSHVTFTCFDMAGALHVVKVRFNNAVHFLRMSAGTFGFDQ